MRKKETWNDILIWDKGISSFELRFALIEMKIQKVKTKKMKMMENVLKHNF